MTTDRPIDGSAVAHILSALGEQDTKAVAQVVAIVDELGETRSVGLVEEAKEVQRRGGMLTHDGRPRSLGGVYFALAREQLSEHARREIFNVLPRRIKQGDATWKPAPRKAEGESASAEAPLPAPERPRAPASAPRPLQGSGDLERLIEEHLRARLPSLIEELVDALVPVLRAEANKLVPAADAAERRTADTQRRRRRPA